MPLDIAVLDENFKYIRTLRLGSIVHGVLFKKIVTTEEYPFLGLAKNDKEDLTFLPEEVPNLVADVEKLEKYLIQDKMMSEEVKGTCLKFTAGLKELCSKAIEIKRNVEFIAGD